VSFCIPSKLSKSRAQQRSEHYIEKIFFEIEKRNEVHFLKIGTNKNHVYFLIQLILMKSLTQIIKMLK